MTSRERFKEEQDRALQVFEDVRAELLRIPGVVDVGIGLKETAGSLVEEVCFRVYVEKKRPEAELSAEEVVPKMIGGFRTDVLKKYEPQLLVGFNDEDDWRNYPIKAGGTRVGNGRGGVGTLGCFARTSDNSTVLLSNHHVLMYGGASIGAKVGQPDHVQSCCCTCNEIAEVVAADAPNDCAIAKLKEGVAFASKVRTIRRADNSVELTGVITGRGVAIVHDEVWKVGARTGLTRGIVEQPFPELIVRPNPPFPRFAYYGDSGSVVVDVNGRVVGLLYAIDKEGPTNKGLAKRIGDVLAALNITIIASDPGPPYPVLQRDEEDVDLEVKALEETAFAPIVDRLRRSEPGLHVLRLFQTHGRECLHLVSHERLVMLAWHRSRGSAFLAALARSAKEPAYRLPTELEGVTRAEAASRLLSAFEAHASPALGAEIETYSYVVEAFLRCDSVEEMITAWERAGPRRPLAKRPG